MQTRSLFFYQCHHHFCFHCRLCSCFSRSCRTSGSFVHRTFLIYQASMRTTTRGAVIVRHVLSTIGSSQLHLHMTWSADPARAILHAHKNTKNRDHEYCRPFRPAIQVSNEGLTATSALTTAAPPGVSDSNLPGTLVPPVLPCCFAPGYTCIYLRMPLFTRYPKYRFAVYRHGTVDIEW